jgi:chromosome segregation ATPase
LIATVFDRPYKGLQAENGGVVGMLEVIQSDFARLESETKASEEQSQKEYDEFTANADTNKAQKKKDIEHKSIAKQDTEQQLQETTSDLEGTQEELGAALTEFDKLKETCLDTGLDYEERVRRREEEIESLRHALRLLEDPEAE